MTKGFRIGRYEAFDGKKISKLPFVKAPNGRCIRFINHMSSKNAVKLAKYYYNNDYKEYFTICPGGR